VGRTAERKRERADGAGRIMQVGGNTADGLWRIGFGAGLWPDLRKG